MNSNSSQNIRRAHRAKRGFALLITLALLAFLVLLLVGLAAYTRIETAVAGNTQRVAQARQHGLLALDVALSQLQKTAGPDRRVTSTAEAFPNSMGTSHYTGVWNATTTGSTPITWLVSGNELSQADGTPNLLLNRPDNAPLFTDTNSATLVGINTSGAPNDVRALLQPIKSYGVPGQNANDTPTTGGTTIGRYAWWVGDQGVKAPVALGDQTTSNTSFNYAPYISAEHRNRIRQQISLGAGAASFESRDGNNAPLVPKVTEFNQLALLKRPDGSTVGLAATKSANYFVWSPNNFTVLMNTKLGGLRQDLSLKPDLLGSAFAAWADYTNANYMEDVTNPVTPSPLQPYSLDPVRRRYRISSAPPITDSGITHKVAPVLCVGLLNFNLRTISTSGIQPIESRLRYIVGLWNPYTSALVPENLRLEIEGLPSSADFVSAGATLASAPLTDSPLVIDLPWEYDRADLVAQDDAQSWLPGRVYYWISKANTAPPNIAHFYRTNFTGFAANVVRQSLSTLDAAANGVWQVRTPSTLIFRLYRGADTVPLGIYTSQAFLPFPSDSGPASSGTAQFTYFVRLDQNKPVPGGAALESWLTSADRDPRAKSPSPTALISGPLGFDPNLYPGNPTPTLLANDDLLLERSMSNLGQSYNEDVPVFELPRSPLLSLGQLQHLAVDGERPFAIGNPWGGANGKTLNGVFDQYFFSGLTKEVFWTGVPLSLPNPHLRPFRRKQDGSEIVPSDISGALDYTSKYLLQGAAFNLNSTSSLAWRAMLRGGRFISPTTFKYLNPSVNTGTASDSPTTEPTDTTTFENAVFFRFPQSAQETEKAEDFVGADIAVPGGLAQPTQAPTQLFRRGVKTLTASQTSDLADAVSRRIVARLSQSGPFRTVEEFLNEGILEGAIADVPTINQYSDGSPLQFSSQFLTQGDIMTALAPVLFPRSDTFIIRTYGEAVNPVTGGTEGRAWCEATVQRVPEYFNPSQQPEETPAGDNATYGRRFKITSFRWLTRSDI